MSVGTSSLGALANAEALEKSNPAVPAFILGIPVGLNPPTCIL